MTDKQNWPVCPRCGFPAAKTETRFGERFDCCDLWSWGRKPLVDAETHEARKAAHAAFDPIWKSGRISRNRAYALLAKSLGLTSDECHMSTMDAATARRVVEAISTVFGSK